MAHLQTPLDLTLGGWVPRPHQDDLATIGVDNFNIKGVREYCFKCRKDNSSRVESP